MTAVTCISHRFVFLFYLRLCHVRETYETSWGIRIVDKGVFDGFTLEGITLFVSSYSWKLSTGRCRQCCCKHFSDLTHDMQPISGL